MIVNETVLPLAVFYGYLKNTEFDALTLRRYSCLDCGRLWQTLEVPVTTDPLQAGAVVGMGGQLRAATTAGAALSHLSLSEQRSALQDHQKRQGRARRTLEDRRIDAEAEASAAGYLAPTGRRPVKKRC